MVSKSFALLASAALALASPLGKRQKSNCHVPVLPVNGDADHELQAPGPELKLKYIGLGIGIQNYTCSEVGAPATATGALAVVYDVTPLYPGQSDSSLSHDAFDTLTSTALWSVNVPLNFNESTGGRVDSSSPGASLTDPFPPPAPLEVDGVDPIAYLGHHFFDADSVPTFDLPAGDKGAVFLPTKKVDNVSAPNDADPGPQGTGAVDWLFLDDAGGASGASAVYRVLTVGGTSHGCANATGEDSATYAATYWFYG